MIRVLIVDDHRIVIDGLKLLLESETGIEVIGTAPNGIEAMAFLKKKKTDIVLMDINMPEMNGIESCKRIQSDYPRVYVIALTMIQEASMIRKMLKAGAKAYLMKNASRHELLKAIETVHEGGTYYTSEVSDIILGDLKGEKNISSAFPKLSRREKQILNLIINELTTTEIAEKLHISFGTVETHRRNIMNKLGARNTAGMVRIALEYKLLD